MDQLMLDKILKPYLSKDASEDDVKVKLRKVKVVVINIKEHSRSLSQESKLMPYYMIPSANPFVQPYSGSKGKRVATPAGEFRSVQACADFYKKGVMWVYKRIEKGEFESVERKPDQTAQI